MADYTPFGNTTGASNDDPGVVGGARFAPVNGAILDGPGTTLVWYRLAGGSTRGGPVTVGNVPAGYLVERFSR